MEVIFAVTAITPGGTTIMLVAIAVMFIETTIMLVAVTGMFLGTTLMPLASAVLCQATALVLG